MNKMKKAVSFLMICLFCLSLLPHTVMAKTVSSVKAEVSKSTITVSGKAESGVLAVAIMVYDADGKLVAMDSGAVSKGAYSVKLSQSFAAGTYDIKVADYEGGEFATAKVTVEKQEAAVIEVSTASATTTEAVTIAVTAAIAGAKKGDTIKAEIPAKTVLSKDAIQKAKDAGVKLEITSGSGAKGSVTWKIAEIGKVVDFDPAVKVKAEVAAIENRLKKDKLPDNTKYTAISFAHDGDLPGKAEVTLDLSECGFKESEPVYLYWYNTARQAFEYVGKGVYKNGSASFEMTHCSDYIVTDNQLKPDSALLAPPKTGDPAGTTAYLMLLFAGAAAVLLAGTKKFAGAK